MEWVQEEKEAKVESKVGLVFYLLSQSSNKINKRVRHEWVRHGTQSI